MLRTAPSLPHTGFSTLGSGLARFPTETASLLPGLLAATRTGLPPASDDELTNTKKHHGLTSRCHLLLCWAHITDRYHSYDRPGQIEPFDPDRPAAAAEERPEAWRYRAFRPWRAPWRWHSVKGSLTVETATRTFWTRRNAVMASAETSVSARTDSAPRPAGAAARGGFTR